MSKKEKIFLIELPIIRKLYDKTQSAKFKGNLEIISNEYGIIKDWKITFEEVSVDTYTTPSWFEQTKNNLFNWRKKLFEEINLEQEKRPNKKSCNVVILDEEQILITNNFFNDREKYNSTIKNIVGILKGNNPGGEAKNPKSAEIILNSSHEPNIKNFVILIDDLSSYSLNYFESYSILAKPKTLTEFIKLNDALKKAFEFMQKNKKSQEFKIYLDGIKKYYNEYNDYAKEGHKIAEAERQKYGNKIKNHYTNSDRKLPFGFSIEENFDFTKCHIYEYYVLKDKIIKMLYEKEKRNLEKYLTMISDPENFIPLHEEVHRRFDRYKFTYDSNGKIHAESNEGLEYIENKIDPKFKKIDTLFLTKNRKKYINKRNKWLIENGYFKNIASKK